MPIYIADVELIWEEEPFSPKLYVGPSRRFVWQRKQKYKGMRQLVRALAQTVRAGLARSFGIE
jgi:hypothetical protein